MEELSSNNINTVENTELLGSEIPAVSINPEILPPAEIQNQVVLFDKDDSGNALLDYIPGQKPKELEVVAIEVTPAYYPSIYEPKYTQTQNEADYVADDLSNSAIPANQNQVVLFDEHELINNTEMDVDAVVPDALADAASQNQHISHIEKTEVKLNYDNIQSYKMAESFPKPPTISAHYFEIDTIPKPKLIQNKI